MSTLCCWLTFVPLLFKPASHYLINSDLAQCGKLGRSKEVLYGRVGIILRTTCLRVTSLELPIYTHCTGTQCDMPRQTLCTLIGDCTMDSTPSHTTGRTTRSSRWL